MQFVNPTDQSPLANMTRDINDFFAHATVILNAVAQTNQRLDALLNGSFPLLQLAQDTTQTTFEMMQYANRHRIVPRMSETIDVATSSFIQASQLATDAREILHNLSAPHVPWILLLCAVCMLGLQTLFIATVVRSAVAPPKRQLRGQAGPTLVEYGLNQVIGKRTSSGMRDQTTS